MPRLKYLIPEYKRKYIRPRRAKPADQVQANRAIARAGERAMKKGGAGITRKMRKGREGQTSWADLKPPEENPEATVSSVEKVES